MSNREQHYVPQVYMKAWQTEVESLSEPNKKFQGVYVFDKGCGLGDGRNRKSILWEPHLYTVNFKSSLAIQSCPKIYQYFVDEIYRLMKTNKPKPIYGKLGYSIIKTKKSIRKHLYEIEDWEFYYYDGNSARKKSIINSLNDLNCYILEEGFDDYYEKRWEDIYKTFIDKVHNGLPMSIGSSERSIPREVAVAMLDFFFVMLCRSPKFDSIGMYTKIKERILEPVFIEREDIDILMTNLWHSELYRILFKKTGGFYHNILSKTLECCQMILFEAYDNVGSFITTDNPAFQSNSMLLKKHISGFIFPITPKYLLFVAKGESDSIDIVDHRFADSDTIKYFNNIIKNNRQNKIISNERIIDS